MLPECGPMVQKKRSGLKLGDTNFDFNKDTLKPAGKNKSTSSSST